MVTRMLCRYEDLCSGACKKLCVVIITWNPSVGEEEAGGSVGAQFVVRLSKQGGRFLRNNA